MLQPLLQVQELTLQFAQASTPVVEAINFSLQPGEAMGLLGESGAGKTTLARTLLRLQSPACRVVRGSVRFRNTEMLQASERDLQAIRGAQIALIGQEPDLALNPVIPVGEQVVEVLRAHLPCKRRQFQEEARSVLAAAGLPEHRMYFAYPHQLSGGQRQRVAIAQALACKPSLLIADEPTSALDNVLQAEILELLRKLRKQFRLALLFISHNPALFSGLADRVAVLHAGRIVEEGSFEEIYRKPRHSFTQALMRAMPAWRGEAVRPPTLQPMPPLLEVRDLRKSYLRGGWRSSTKSHTAALDGADLQISCGTTLALVGPSGSGKSTLGRCVARWEEPDTGEILFWGQNLLTLPRSDLIPLCRRIQLVFQHSAAAMNPLLPAVEIVGEPLRMQPGITRKDRRERALAMMEQVGLSAQWGERRPAAFSGGQRQRLAIARALILKPDLLILDEALAGLDLSTQAQIGDMLMELQASFSMSFLFITHDLPMAARLAQTVAVMHGGKIAVRGSVAEVFASPRPEIRDLLRSLPQAEAATDGSR